MATVTAEVRANDATGVAKVDMKFEIVVIPVLGCRPREGVLREILGVAA